MVSGTDLTFPRKLRQIRVAVHTAHALHVMLPVCSLDSNGRTSGVYRNTDLTQIARKRQICATYHRTLPAARRIWLHRWRAVPRRGRCQPRPVAPSHCSRESRSWRSARRRGGSSRGSRVGCRRCSSRCGICSGQRVRAGVVAPRDLASRVRLQKPFLRDLCRLVSKVDVYVCAAQELRLSLWVGADFTDFTSIE